MIYNNPIVVSVALVPVIDDNQNFLGLLGIQRGIEPFIGGLAFPGGYQDEMELSKDAAVRELEQETGLKIDKNQFKFFNEKMTAHNKNLQFWYSTPIKADDVFQLIELDEFDKREIFQILIIDDASKICFPTHREIFEEFKTFITKEKNQGFSLS